MFMGEYTLVDEKLSPERQTARLAFQRKEAPAFSWPRGTATHYLGGRLTGLSVGRRVAIRGCLGSVSPINQL